MRGAIYTSIVFILRHTAINTLKHITHNQEPSKMIAVKNTPQNKIDVWCTEEEAFQISEARTPLQLAQDADIQNYINERRALGIIDGRDWTGCLVAPQPLRQEAPLTCALYRMACPTATAEQEASFAKEVRAFAERSWWTLFGDEMMAAEAAEAVEYAATKAEREAKSAVVIASFNCNVKAERTAIRNGAARNRNGAINIVKKQEPCKFLYDCQGTPARPTTMRVSTECWSHEYTHPETGKVIAKHVCDRLHPGEEGWCEQWNTDRLWKPSAAPTRTWDEGRFAAPRQHAGRDLNRRR